LTIPGIVYVVDPGFARVNRYDVRTGVSQLLVEPVSRASADQRKGRCGRVQSGVCFRLYEEQDFASRPAHTDPEIKRVGLAGVILRMMALGLGDIAAFPFLDPPQTRAIGEGYRTLEELGALDEQRMLTPIGEQLGRLPLDPRLGRMILGGRDERALREVVIIASVLGLQDPRERPLAERQRADEAHRKFRDEGSDFVGYLKLWADWRDAYDRLSRRQLQKWCRDHFLSYVRMREWDDIHEQIVRVMRELEFAPNAQPASGEQIHRALLPGLLSKIGMWNPEARNYLGARQTRFVIHPGSALGKKPPAWVMAAELVETSQLFARTVAKLDPVWVEAVAGPLCRRSHGDPHWEQKAGQVIAREQVTLFGLPIVKSRPVPYALHDPALCRELFITHALCRHEYVTKGAFMEQNRAVQAEVQRLRDKARKSDMFADEDALFAFFDRKLPASVVSGKTFEAWRREAEARDPKTLVLSLGDLLVADDRDLSPAQFPDELVFGGTKMPLAYRFDPGADDDGITMTVPLAVLPALDPAVMAWTIPGWHRAKIVALLESLSKARRKSLGATVDELADTLAKQLRPFDGPMLPALEAAILDVTGERISRDQWNPIPPYLHFTFHVVDDHDKSLGSGRDLAELQRELAGRAQKLWAAAPRASFEKQNLRGWDFDALPESVAIEVSGRRVAAYPALVDVVSAVELRLLESPAAALAASRAGVRRLLIFQSQTSMTKLEAQLPATLTRELRKDLVNRALDEAFDLDGDLPRDRAAFAHRLAKGRGLIAGILAELARFATEIATHTTKIQTTLRPLVGKPGIIRALVDDVQSQLAHLVPADLWHTASLARLGHIVRYLQALQIRLQRQSHDPQKDAQKAAPVVPIWQAFLARRAELATRGRRPEELEQFRWLIEELRVQVFAPELRTPMPVSLPRMQDLWAALVR
jgi:ATP-dependent helicase HrpA